MKSQHSALIKCNRILILLVFVIFCGAFSSSLADSLYPSEGSCGQNSTWHLEDGVLTITGSGVINDYTESSTPWYGVKNRIQSVVIDEGITRIGAFAFYETSSLVSVSFPNSLLEIGSFAFMSTNITNISLPMNLTTIEENAFGWCWGIQSVIIPNSVTSIGAEAFNACVNLNSLTLPSGITTIAYKSFSNTRISTINVPDGVTSIGVDAFSSCKVTTVYLPSTVKTIDTNAFDSCSKLSVVHFSGYAYDAERICIKPGNSSLTSSVWYCIDETLDTLSPTVGECGSSATWVLEGSVLTISGAGAINDYAEASTPWYGVSGRIESVVIGEGITRIGTKAFYNTKSITSISFPNSLLEIGDFAFGSTNITNLSLPMNLTTIGENAFGWCWGIQSIIIPDSVTYIGAEAFNSCVNLKTVTLPKGITAIADSVFCNTRISTINIPNGVISIGVSAFSSCKLMTIYLPDSIAVIDTDAFDECSQLTDVYYAGKAQYAKDISINAGNSSLMAAVWHCDDITLDSLYASSGECGPNATWSLNDGVLSIMGTGAVNDYSETSMPWYEVGSKIIKVIIGDGITKIGAYAFYDIESITSVEFPDSLLEIGQAAFKSSGIKDIELPPNLVTIKEDAFGWCWNLVSIRIPDSVTYIGAFAFDGCARLKTVALSTGLTSIERYAFKDTKITTITIPDSVTSIGEGAFSYCKLVIVFIPDTISAVGTNAFSNCSELSDVYYSGSSALAQQIGIASGNSYLTSALWHYNYDYTWKNQILHLPNGLEDISDMAFFGISAGVLIIPNGCETIGNKAFSNCYNLHEAYIPSSVISIGNNAFDNEYIIAIYGVSGSYAEEWANQNGFTFIGQ